MAFPYKHVLLVGATAGIGKAMADKLIESGCKVTAVGRRKDRLGEFVKQHGSEYASAIPFDMGSIENTPQFAADVMKTHPTVDCLFLNAGIQNRFDFSDPASVDLETFNNEFHVNFTGHVALTHAFLPYFLKKEEKTSIIFTGTIIAVIPAVTLSAYSASKGALNMFAMCLRNDLRNTNIKVVDILPPIVQTELHDYMGEEQGRAMGMPVKEFVNLAYDELVKGEEEIVLGAVGSKEKFDGLMETRRELFDAMTARIRPSS